jgi:hypothetical protein
MTTAGRGRPALVEFSSLAYFPGPAPVTQAIITEQHIGSTIAVNQSPPKTEYLIVWDGPALLYMMQRGATRSLVLIQFDHPDPHVPRAGMLSYFGAHVC